MFKLEEYKHYQKGFTIHGMLVLVGLFLLVGGAYVISQKQRSDLSSKNTANVPAVEGAIANSPSPENQTDEVYPYIESITPASGPIGTIVTLKGQNLAGFEGDLDAWIENDNGETAFMPGIGEVPRNDQTIRIKIEKRLCKQNNNYSGKPCNDYLQIVPGTYSIYTRPWEKTSNKVKFTVTGLTTDVPKSL